MTDAIEFFVHSRAASGAAEPDPALTEEHWSYMDRFADAMIARGPTLTADREGWTGSVHIVGLPSPEAAREFVEREPYHRAGLFEEHLIRRFHNLLGRTMWGFPGESGDPRFMVIAQLPADAGEDAATVPPIDLTGVAPERLIVHGALLTPEEARPAGVVLALEAPARRAVEALLSGDGYPDVQIHDWEFGGRR